MTISRDLFSLLILTMPDVIKKKSVQELRSYQNKHGLLKGFRIMDTAFKSPNSRLAQALVKHFEGHNPLVLGWLRKMSAVIIPADVSVSEIKARKDSSAHDPEKKLLFSADMVRMIEDRPSTAAFGLTASALEEIATAVRNLADSERTESKIREIELKTLDSLYSVLTLTPKTAKFIESKYPTFFSDRGRSSSAVPKGMAAASAAIETSGGSIAAPDEKAPLHQTEETLDASEAKPTAEKNESPDPKPEPEDAAANDAQSATQPSAVAAENSPNADEPRKPAQSVEAATPAKSSGTGSKKTVSLAKPSARTDSASASPLAGTKRSGKKAIAEALASTIAVEPVSAALFTRTGANADHAKKPARPLLTREQLAATTAALLDLRAAKIPEPIPTIFPVENPFEKLAEPELGCRRAIGRVHSSGTFRNFFPAALFGNGTWREISVAEAKSLFPRIGGVNLHTLRPQTFFEGGLYILDWTDNDLAANIDNLTNEKRTDFELRVDYQSMRRAKRVRPASDVGGFLVVYPETEDLAASNNIYVRFTANPDDKVSKANVSELRGTQVLLGVEDRLYGPYKLVEDGLGRPCVAPKLQASGGILRGFILSDPTRIRHYSEERRTPDGTLATEFFDVVFVDGLQAAEFDLYDSSTLLKRVGALIGASKKAREEVDAWLAREGEASKLFSDDDRIRKARTKRIKSALKRADVTEAFSSEIAEIAKRTISKEENGELVERLAENIASDPEKLMGFAAHAKVVRAMNETKAALEKERREAKEFEETAEARKKAFEDALRTDNKSLIEENRALEAEIDRHRGTLGAIADCSDAIEMRARLESDVQAARDAAARYRTEIAGLDEYLKNAVSNAKHYAFDGALASKFLEAAAEWEHRGEAARYRDRAASIAGLPVSNLTGVQLADYLVDRVRIWRRYDRNTILNIFISLTQSFLTIFTGDPGTGKTTGAEIAAHALGLTTLDRVLGDAAAALWDEASGANRFLPISVERGWTSKRDFLGFYNTLAGRFESPDIRRSDAFRQLDAEAKAGFEDIPYLMLLDEANLSPMEFYWADFMNVADARTALSSISLGDGTRYAIPESLRFIATINNDFTTETLSPRLIDRANVITLPTPERASLVAASPALDLDVPHPVISRSALETYFGDRPVTENVCAAVDEAVDVMTGTGCAVSARTIRAMYRHAAAGAAVFETKDGRSPLCWACDFAVSQKLLPKINGSGEAYRSALEAMRELANERRWTNSSRALERILTRGDANMGDYAFF